MVVNALKDPKAISVGTRRAGWLCFALVIVIALLIERRIPSFSIVYSNPLFQNWAHTIGELTHISPANPIWLRWCGYLLLVTPFLVWFSVAKTRHKSELTPPPFVLVLLVATYVLTIWQARWGYFFVLIFALALPRLLEPIKSRGAVWIAFFLSIFSILRDWDERLWPNEAELALRVEQRDEFSTVARPGAQFAIVRDSPVPGTVVAFTIDRLLVRAARDSWKLARRSGRHCGQRAIFPLRRLAKSTPNSGESPNGVGYCVQFRTCGAKLGSNFESGSAFAPAVPRAG